MGYYSEYDGSIDIKNADKETLTGILDPILDSIQENLPDGNIDVSEHQGTVSINLYGYSKWYDWDDDLNELVKTLTDKGYDVEGLVNRTGEDGGDIERWTCRNGESSTRGATIVFATKEEIIAAIKDSYPDGPEAIYAELSKRELI